MVNDCEYRSIEFRAQLPNEGKGKSFIVEGYAATYEPYVLMTVDDVNYYERIEPTAFIGADLSDVVFRVDHTGTVYARTTAGTLKVWADSHGLAQRADLGKTKRARELFADIAAGNYTKLSFAFSVAKDRFDKDTHTRIIEKIARVYDVSPCAFPQNPMTGLSVSTREMFDRIIENDMKERQKARIRILTKV